MLASYFCIKGLGKSRGAFCGGWENRGIQLLRNPILEWEMLNSLNGCFIMPLGILKRMGLIMTENYKQAQGPFGHVVLGFFR